MQSKAGWKPGRNGGPEHGTPQRCGRPTAHLVPLPAGSFSFVLIHCMALAEILVPKFLSNGEGAPPCWWLELPEC